jgi:hypothetical protein
LGGIVVLEQVVIRAADKKPGAGAVDGSIIDEPAVGGDGYRKKTVLSDVGYGIIRNIYR